MTEFVQNKDIAAFKNEQTRISQIVQEKVFFLNDVVKTQTQTLERQLFTNVRRAMSQYEGTAKTEKPNKEIDEFIKTKADSSAL